MVTIRPPISISSSPLSNPLETVPITIGITIIFMFYSFLSSLARSKSFSLFSVSLIFTLWSAKTTKFILRQVLYFFSIITGLVFWPGLGDLLLLLSLLICFFPLKILYKNCARQYFSDTLVFVISPFFPSTIELRNSFNRIA